MAALLVSVFDPDMQESDLSQVFVVDDIFILWMAEYPTLCAFACNRSAFRI
jgi:hypothetical protein